MSRDIYSLDDSIANLIKSENFQGKFDVAAFVESLSEKQLARQRERPGDAFEPKPLIRDFETALQKLNALKAQIGNDITRNTREVENAEKAHNIRIRQLNQKFEVRILYCLAVRDC